MMLSNRTDLRKIREIYSKALNLRKEKYLSVVVQAVLPVAQWIYTTD